MKYLFPFLFSLVLSSAFCAILLRLKFFRKWTPQERSLKNDSKKKRFIPRWGGLVVIFAFCIGAFAERHLQITPDVRSLFIGAACIAFFGLVDDIKRLSWKWQLAFQMSLSVGIYVFGTRVVSLNNPFGNAILLGSENIFSLSLLVGVVWFLLLMNALNWIDGMDGLGSGVVVIAACTLFILSIRPDVFQPPTAILSILLAGSFLGLLFFNFHPAKIFLGTSGSFFAGFSLAYLSVFAGAKMATAFIVLMIPIIDAVWVIINRYREGRSLFLSDYTHIHQRLYRSGWPVWRIIIFCYGVTILFAVFALLSDPILKCVTFFGGVSFLLFFLIKIQLQQNKDKTP